MISLKQMRAEKQKKLNLLSRNILSDSEIRICPKNSRKSRDIGKHEFDRTEFYKACNDIPCDVFKCLETERDYIPGNRELFWFVGRYKKYVPKGKYRIKQKCSNESEE